MSVSTAGVSGSGAFGLTATPADAGTSRAGLGALPPPDLPQIVARFPWKRAAAFKIGRVTRRSRVVCAKQAGIAETVVHQAQIEGAGKDIVARRMRIPAETEAAAHLGPGRRHQLHQSHGAGMTDDRATVRKRSSAAFGDHDALDPWHRNA